jgi:hypothetical protein
MSNETQTWELPPAPPSEVLCVRDADGYHWARTLSGDEWRHMGVAATWAVLLAQTGRVTACGCLAWPAPTADRGQAPDAR